MKRPLTRADLPKKVRSANGLHKPAFLNGEKVWICDIHFADASLCYLEGAQGIATKIEDLEIERLEPHERGQGRRKSDSPKVNITYRIAPDLAEWLAAQDGPTKALEKALKRASDGDEKSLTKAFKAGAKLAFLDFQIDKSDVETALDNYIWSL